MALERLVAMLADFVCRILVYATSCVGMCVLFVVQNAAMCFLGVVCLICESRICRESRFALEADHSTNALDETTNKYHNFVDGTERISQQFATHTNETEERIKDIYNTFLGNDLECLRIANVALLLTTLGLLYALGGALLGTAFILKPQGHQWCIKQRATAWFLSTAFSLIVPIYVDLSSLTRITETQMPGIFRTIILLHVVLYGLTVFVQLVMYVTCIMPSAKSSTVHSSYNMMCVDKIQKKNSLV